MKKITCIILSISISVSYFLNFNSIFLTKAFENEEENKKANSINFYLNNLPDEETTDHIVEFLNQECSEEFSNYCFFVLKDLGANPSFLDINEEKLLKYKEIFGDQNDLQNEDPFDDDIENWKNTLHCFDEELENDEMPQMENGEVPQQMDIPDFSYLEKLLKNRKTKKQLIAISKDKNRSKLERIHAMKLLIDNDYNGTSKTPDGRAMLVSYAKLLKYDSLEKTEILQAIIGEDEKKYKNVAKDRYGKIALQMYAISGNEQEKKAALLASVGEDFSDYKKTAKTELGKKAILKLIKIISCKEHILCLLEAIVGKNCNEYEDAIQTKCGQEAIILYSGIKKSLEILKKITNDSSKNITEEIIKKAHILQDRIIQSNKLSQKKKLNRRLEKRLRDKKVEVNKIDDALSNKETLSKLTNNDLLVLSEKGDKEQKNNALSVLLDNDYSDEKFKEMSKTNFGINILLSLARNPSLDKLVKFRALETIIKENNSNFENIAQNLYKGRNILSLYLRHILKAENKKNVSRILKIIVGSDPNYYLELAENKITQKELIMFAEFCEDVPISIRIKALEAIIGKTPEEFLKKREDSKNFFQALLVYSSFFGAKYRVEALLIIVGKNPDEYPKIANEGDEKKKALLELSKIPSFPFRLEAIKAAIGTDSSNFLSLSKNETGRFFIVTYALITKDVKLKKEILETVIGKNENDYEEASKTFSGARALFVYYSSFSKKPFESLIGKDPKLFINKDFKNNEEKWILYYYSKLDGSLFKKEALLKIIGDDPSLYSEVSKNKLGRKALISYGRLENVENQKTALEAIIGTNPNEYKNALLTKEGLVALVSYVKIPNTPHGNEIINLLISYNNLSYEELFSIQIGKEILLCCARNPEFKDRNKIIKKFIGDDPEKFCNLPKTVGIKQALLIYTKNKDLNIRNKYLALRAIVGHNQADYADALHSGKYVTEALVRLSGICGLSTTEDRILMLKTIVGCTKESFLKAHSKKDKWTDIAIYNCGKFPDFPNRIEALKVLIGEDSSRYEEIVKAGTRTEQDALSQYAKIHTAPFAFDAARALVESYTSYEEAAKTPLGSEYLLNFARRCADKDSRFQAKSEEIYEILLGKNPEKFKTLAENDANYKNYLMWYSRTNFRYSQEAIEAIVGKSVEEFEALIASSRGDQNKEALLIYAQKYETPLRIEAMGILFRNGYKIEKIKRLAAIALKPKYSQTNHTEKSILRNILESND